MEIKTKVYIDKNLQNLFDPKQLERKFESIIWPELTASLKDRVKAEMLSGKSPKIRTGKLYRNVNYLTYRKATGMYVGEVGVNRVVNYSRILELGGKLGRAKSRRITPRYYLRKPIFQHIALVLNKVMNKHLLKSQGSGGWKEIK